MIRPCDVRFHASGRGGTMIRPCDVRFHASGRGGTMIRPCDVYPDSRCMLAQTPDAVQWQESECKDDPQHIKPSHHETGQSLLGNGPISCT